MSDRSQHKPRIVKISSRSSIDDAGISLSSCSRFLDAFLRFLSLLFIRSPPRCLNSSGCRNRFPNHVGSGILGCNPFPNNFPLVRVFCGIHLSGTRASCGLYLPAARVSTGCTYLEHTFYGVKTHACLMCVLRSTHTCSMHVLYASSNTC